MVAKKFNTRSRRRIAPLIGEEPSRKKYGDEIEIEELWEEIQMHKLDDHRDDPEMNQGPNELDKIRRLQVIKELSVPFRTRKKLRDHMNEVAGEFQGKGFSAWKYKQKLQFEKWKNRRVQGWNNFQYAIELWGTTCTKIEGYAGSGVVSYFHMLRWIFQMDFFLFLLVLGFIIIPQIFFPSKDYAALDRGPDDIDSLKNSTNVSLIVETCSSFYQRNITLASAVIDNILNFLYGSGWMEETAMFYGHYDAYDERESNFEYDTSAAYISTNFAVFFVSLLVLVKIAGGGYQARLELKDSSLKNYSAKVYAYWDYGLTSQKNARNKQKTIWRELKLDLAEERRKRKREERTNCQVSLLVSKRLFINLFIIGTLGGAGYLIYYVSVEQARLVEDSRYSSWHTVVQFLIQFMTSLAISVLNAILPMIYKALGRLEEYSPAFEVNMTLFRTIFLKLSSLTILIITIYTTITCNPQDICGTGTGSCTAVKCWETYVGQEIYKLIIMDFIIAVLMTFLVETPRALIGKCCKAKFFQLIGSPTFDLPKNVLDLIYGQTLFWLGVFFSPMIPVIVVIKLFLVFYMKFFSTMINYQPNETPFRASDTQSFYVYILFCDFIICLIPIFYVIWQIPPSRGCGPFRDLRYMYNTIGDGVGEGPAWLNDVLSFIISPLVLITIIFILFLLLWYSISKIGAYQRLTKRYKEDLAQEGLTVQALMKIAKGQKVTDLGDPKMSLLPNRNQQNKQPNNHLQKDSFKDKKSANHDDHQYDNQMNDHAIDPIYQDLDGDDQFQIEDHETKDNKMLFNKPTQQSESNRDSETMPKYSQVNKNNKTTNDHNDHRETHYDNRGFESEYDLSEEPPMDY